MLKGYRGDRTIRLNRIVPQRVASNPGAVPQRMATTNMDMLISKAGKTNARNICFKSSIRMIDSRGTSSAKI